MVAVGWLVERNEEGVGTSPRSRVQSPKWNYEGLIFENSVRSGVDIFSGSSTQVVDFPHLRQTRRAMSLGVRAALCRFVPLGKRGVNLGQGAQKCYSEGLQGWGWRGIVRGSRMGHLG